MFFNKLLNKVKPYQVVSHKAWESKDPKEVLKLDWNEATVPPSPKVAESLLEFINSGCMNWYPDVDNRALREQIAKYSDVSVSQVEYYASSDSLHEYIIKAFISTGDIVTLIGPTYDNFRAAAESSGAEIDFFYLQELNEFRFCIESFESHLEKVQPKIVYICNPNNPTGTSFEKETIESLAKRFNDVLFIVDEAYFEFGQKSVAGLVGIFENIVVCRTFSKAFALASFRVGYAISSEHNIQGLSKVRNAKNISSYSQIAALSALYDLDYMNSYVEEVRQAKTQFIGGLNKLDLKVVGSESGNFVLVDFGSRKSEIIKHLESCGIYVRNYEHMAVMSKFTRITVGTRKQMEKVIRIIAEVVHAK